MKNKIIKHYLGNLEKGDVAVRINGMIDEMISYYDLLRKRSTVLIHDDVLSIFVESTLCQDETDCKDVLSLLGYTGTIVDFKPVDNSKNITFDVQNYEKIK